MRALGPPDWNALALWPIHWAHWHWNLYTITHWHWGLCEGGRWAPPDWKEGAGPPGLERIGTGASAKEGAGPPGLERIGIEAFALERIGNEASALDA